MNSKTYSCLLSLPYHQNHLAIWLKHIHTPVFHAGSTKSESLKKAFGNLYDLHDSYKQANLKNTVPYDTASGMPVPGLLVWITGARRLRATVQFTNKNLALGSSVCCHRQQHEICKEQGESPAYKVRRKLPGFQTVLSMILWSEMIKALKSLPTMPMKSFLFKDEEKKTWVEVNN